MGREDSLALTVPIAELAAFGSAVNVGEDLFE